MWRRTSRRDALAFRNLYIFFLYMLGSTQGEQKSGVGLEGGNIGCSTGERWRAVLQKATRPFLSPIPFVLSSLTLMLSVNLGKEISKCPGSVRSRNPGKLNFSQDKRIFSRRMVVVQTDPNSSSSTEFSPRTPKIVPLIGCLPGKLL